MRVYYDRDADLNLIKGKKVAIIGYGSQGHAHALNLRDSGVKEVAVGLRKTSGGVKKAEGEKFKVMEVAEAAKWADVMMMLTPDELQGDIYRDHLAANMKQGAALMFAHGLNVHFNLIEPRPDLDVLMVAPKGPRINLEAAKLLFGNRASRAELDAAVRHDVEYGDAFGDARGMIERYRGTHCENRIDRRYRYRMALSHWSYFRTRGSCVMSRGFPHSARL